MIIGAHVLLYSEKPEADRAFFRDVLGFRAIDAGGGWLIFALPPAEVALHPVDQPKKGSKRKVARGDGGLLGAQLYLMCEDLKALMQSLKAKKVKCSPVDEVRWGLKTTIRLPSGGELGLYQPKHPTALDLD